ncbi:MAG TPA: murein biosynthesis integral membrane protein MurJ [Vicinamibacteria bacterium]|nr:murein biosynthesis integral membrane protein MurJ [Vicinamibacteria bacterium]
MGRDPEVKATSEKARIARAASLVSAMTLVSRIFGLVREMAFASLVGAGYHSDAFRIGFRIPNLLRDLFAEGALSAAFVPTYARTQKEDGREAAFALANSVLTVLAVLLGAVVVAAAALAWPIVSGLAPGFDDQPGKAALTVLLTRVMMPFLLLVSFAAVAMGMLNAEERFAVPALSPALFNVVAILWAVLLWAMKLPIEQVVLGWAIGTLVGGLAQFGVQVPSLRRLGWRFRPRWAPRDPGLLRIARLMAPATVGLAAVQVNIFVSSRFASEDPGAVSWLDYAFRLLYLPIGLFGVALGTIATSGLARRAAEGDMAGLRDTLRQALSMLAFLTVPATVGLMVLRVPVVRLIYERGRFTPGDTDGTATALAAYSLGLLGYSGVKVIAPAFYALGRPRIPLLGSGLAVATNLVVILVAHRSFGFRAVAFGTAMASLVNLAFLGAAFERRMGGLLGHGLFRPVIRMGLAAAVMGLLAWLSAAGLEHVVGSRGHAAHALTGLVPVLAGILAYLALTRAMRVGEAEILWHLLAGRLRPGSKG